MSTENQALKMSARLRYRINGGDLLLGYRLNRITDARDDAFSKIVEKVGQAGYLVLRT